MSIRKLQITIGFTALLSASILMAHDAKLHKGNATEGEIVSIAAGNVVMRTAKGNVTVTLNKATKFEMGDTAVDLNHFKKGDKVTVIGTKLATGELVAKELIMPTPGSKDAAHKH